MNLEQTDQGFILTFGGVEIIRHTKSVPLIHAGAGKASYKMSRGSFKIRDAIHKKVPLSEFIIENAQGRILIKLFDKTGAFQLHMEIIPSEDKLEMAFTSRGKFINRVWLNIKALPEEHVYGCGEHFTHFDLRGQKVRIWVAEHQSLNRLVSKVIRKKLLFKKNEDMMAFHKYETYYAQPTFISSRKFFLHVSSDAYMEFDFSQRTCHQLMIREVPEKIIIGKNTSYPALFENLSNLLGRQPRLPDWIYQGAVLGIQGGTEVLLEKLDKALKCNMRVSAVWCQDWEGRRITAFGKQLMWNWEWDRALYPHLDSEIKKLAQKGIRFLGYINPFLAIEGNLYKEASRLGYTVKTKDGEDYMVTITTFPAAMLDLTNPEAFDWIKGIIKTNMIELGLSGWMADFGEYLPVDALLHSGKSAEIVHNTWPALWAKANREAIEEAGKLGEIIFFTRAGHTRSIRYSTLMWNGDQHVDWSLDDGLASVIPGTLSLAMSGFGLCHSDIGGYTTFSDIKRSKALLMRWTELGAFSPVMRTHEGNRPDDNIQFDADEEILAHFARMSRIYHALSFYIKACVDENADCGLPVMRPLFMHYDNDREAHTIKYQYLLGRDLLVAPVYKAKCEHWQVYLPKDQWTHLWNHRDYEGGWVEVEAPMGYPPVFYRRSSAYAEKFRMISEMLDKV